MIKGALITGGVCLSYWLDFGFSFLDPSTVAWRCKPSYGCSVLSLVECKIRTYFDSFDYVCLFMRRAKQLNAQPSMEALTIDVSLVPIAFQILFALIILGLILELPESPRWLILKGT